MASYENEDEVHDQKRLQTTKREEMGVYKLSVDAFIYFLFLKKGISRCIIYKLFFGLTLFIKLFLVEEYKFSL